MSLSFFIMVMFCLQGFYWLVGRYSSNKTLGKEDYFLAGKSVALFPLMMTLLHKCPGGPLCKIFLLKSLS